MNRLENLAQNHTQAPWRKQLQIVGLFLLFVVGVSLVAGIYLSVSAKAAAVGRDIQDKNELLDAYDREIEDMQSRLAAILSTEEMEARALKLGFQVIDPEQVVYANIPGYADQSRVVLAAKTPRSVVGARIMPVEYTESLFSWIKRQVVSQNLVLSGVTP
jgi:cell division protein FtsL